MDTLNPFSRDYVEPEPAEAAESAAPRGPLLTKPGAYPGVSIEAYHRDPNLLPAPSLSSSGIKTLLDKSPRHFWQDSVMNPDRPAEASKRHFNLGKAIHDRLLLPERWNDEFYHVTPTGFVAAHVNKWAGDLPAWKAATRSGKTILPAEEAATVEKMAASVGEHELAKALLISGASEQTLVWQDQSTGVWLRARPDITPDMRAIVPDLKSELDPSPAAFEKKADNLRYFHSAALYLDGLEAIYGPEKDDRDIEVQRRFVFIVVEKAEPFTVTLYQADETDVHRARMENRWAINLFATCLKRGTDRASWPGYSDAVLPLGMPGWTRKRIDQAAEDGTLSYHA